MARHRHLATMRRGLVLALLLALAVPAGARATDALTGSEAAALATERYYSSYDVRPITPVRAVATAPDSFDWADAALGAGAALGLAFVLSGGVALRRRGRPEQMAARGAG